MEIDSNGKAVALDNFIKEWKFTYFDKEDEFEIQISGSEV